MTKLVESFGTIPFTSARGQLQFLVIQMYSSAGGTHWTFPKGRPEAGEDPLTTALRETREEVGLTVEPIANLDPLIERYEFVGREGTISKTVIYYLARSKETPLTLQTSEVKEASWLSYEAARKQLSYEEKKLLLDQAFEQLRKAGITT